MLKEALQAEGQQYVDLHKRMKNARNGRQEGKYKTVIFHVKNLKYQRKMKTKYYGICNICRNKMSNNSSTQDVRVQLISQQR